MLAESELSSLPKACEDPRLGSVWALAVAVYHPHTGSAARYSKEVHNGGAKVGDVIPFGCGDLLVMQSEQWSYPVLGIVQPWDPDFDLKYGVNFAIYQGGTSGL